MNEKDLHTMCNPSRNNRLKSEKYDSMEKKSQKNMITPYILEQNKS